jgi:hypothetical protein
MNQKSIHSLILLLGLALNGHAQTKGFACRGRLDTVRQAGFYNIELLPPVHACCKTDFSDVRIVNDSGRWVPHLLRLPATEYHVATALWDMPFVSKTVTASSVICVVKNGEPLVDNIQLVLKNTSAQRSCNISGSFNGNDWFIINDSILLQETAVTRGDETTCTLRFPPSAYPYFKLVVDNQKTDPVNIVRLGSVGPVTAAAPAAALKRLEENPDCSVTQLDSGRISYIRVTQKDAYQLEWLALKLSGVKYFSRTMDIYIPSGNDHSFAKPGRFLQSVTVSNNSTLEYSLSQMVKVPVFYLLINNNDNLPLRVTSVSTAIRYRVLTAYLEKGNGYRLLAGNDSIGAPIYDVAALQDELPKDLPVLNLSGMWPNRNPLAEEPMLSPKSAPRYWLWGSLAIVLALLLYLTARMLREVNKRNGDGPGDSPAE